MAASGNVSTKQVAIVTGGASGIGLSVAEHLVNKGWHVAIFDLDQEAGDKVIERVGSNIVFIHVDVSNYEHQAAAFAKTWDIWHRLDFVFANAVCCRHCRVRDDDTKVNQGIADNSKLSAPAKPRADGLPARPDTTVIDINLVGVAYSAYLALHFFRQNANKGGKLVSTSSMAGLYPSRFMPLYTASKHGVSLPCPKSPIAAFRFGAVLTCLSYL